MTHRRCHRKHLPDRRTFVGQIGAATTAALIEAGHVASPAQSFNREITNRLSLETLIQLNDVRVTESLTSQQLDPTASNYGGFPNRHGICFVGTAANLVSRWVVSLLSPKSRFHKSELLTERLNLAMQFLLEAQHADGTIDLVSTNFHSPPDTGFVVEPLALAVSCIRNQDAEALADFRSRTETFLSKAGDALVRGGIHTPNHRWVVCSALSRIHNLIPDQKYVDRIDQWLTEKIDIDAEGHYAERSTSMYSPLVNRCLITMSRILDRPELLEPVRRNLELTKFLLHANGELVTEVSRRQDQFRVARPRAYYYSYRKMAQLDNDRNFGAMAQRIHLIVGDEGLVAELPRFLEDADLKEPVPSSGSPPDNYEKHFTDSACVRIRREQVDATILGGNPVFFTLHKNDAAIRAVRLASAFFGKGQFVADSLVHENDRYILGQELSGPYFQPLSADQLPGDGNWFRMDRDSRRQSEVQNLTTIVEVKETDGFFKLHFRVFGTSGVPLALEIAMDREGELSGVQPVEGVADAWRLSAAGGQFRRGDDVISFGPGRSKHSWTQLRGALPKLDARCVYITDYSPFDFELTIS